MRVIPVDGVHAGEAIALLDALRVSLFGISSRPLHAALVADGLANRLDCRVAVDAGRVCGVVIAAPASYWRTSLVRHWRVGAASALARLSARRDHGAAEAALVPAAFSDARGAPATWREPRDAWRIVIVGTAADARGRGVGSSLYRGVMADRSLVARIARDNEASLRLHASLGWRLYDDGDVVLAVHVCEAPNRPPQPSAARSRAAVR